MKLKSVAYLTLIASPFAFIIEGIGEWFNINIAFIGFVFGAVIIDHLVGTYVHAKIKKDFSMKKNIQGFFMKAFLIVGVYFLGRGIVHILGEENVVAIYFRMIMRLMVFIYPAGSALVNISIITKGKFPPIGFMEKITRFNKNMDLNEFKEKE